MFLFLFLKLLKVDILLLISGDIVAKEHFSSGGGLQEDEEEGEEKHKTHQDRLKEQIQKKNLEKVLFLIISFLCLEFYGST